MTFHLSRAPILLHLIRHGEVEERYHNVFGGSRIDMKLSPLGERQAIAVADAIANWKLDAVYASPMRRVSQTLLPTVRPRGLSVNVLEDLREMDFGEWTGHKWTEVETKFGVSPFDWLEKLESHGVEGGENGAALADRVRRCLHTILEKHPEQSVAIFCHGGIIRVILALMLNQPLAKMAHYNIDYASITTLEVQPKKKHAVELNLLNWCPWQATENLTPGLA